MALGPLYIYKESVGIKGVKSTKTSNKVYKSKQLSSKIYKK